MDRTGAWPRRRVLAGMVGVTAALGAPAILRAAPSGTPVKVGGTLSLTGFLAQTAVIHKIASEIMVEEINGRNGFLGRPVEYVLLDDQSKPDVARSLYEKLITVDKVDLLVGPYATNMVAPAVPVIMQHNMTTISILAIGVNRHFHYGRYFDMIAVGPEGTKVPMPSFPKPPPMVRAKTPRRRVSRLFMTKAIRRAPPILRR